MVNVSNEEALAVAGRTGAAHPAALPWGGAEDFIAGPAAASVTPGAPGLYPH
jgi:hypothetical protein